MMIYLFIAIGILISVLLPILRSFLPNAPAGLRIGPGHWANVWQVVSPYVYTGLFALVGAVLIMAAVGDDIDTWQKAIIAGYAWDATLQKLRTGNGPSATIVYQTASTKMSASPDVVLQVDVEADTATIKNNGSSEIDLTDWTLRSVEGDQHFVFKNPLLVKSRESVVVTSGPNQPRGPGYIHWSDSHKWRNKGDAGELMDPDGNVVAEDL